MRVGNHVVGSVDGEVEGLDDEGLKDGVVVGPKEGSIVGSAVVG